MREDASCGKLIGAFVHNSLQHVFPFFFLIKIYDFDCECEKKIDVFVCNNLQHNSFLHFLLKRIYIYIYIYIYI